MSNFLVDTCSRESSLGAFSAKLFPKAGEMGRARGLLGF